MTTNKTRPDEENNLREFQRELRRRERIGGLLFAAFLVGILMALALRLAR